MAGGNILVIGGGGYIGSHAVLDLRASGFNPVIVDNFSRGNRDIAESLESPIREGDIGDREFCRDVFQEFEPSAVMHFAALAYVGESVEQPADYYRNNVVNALVILDAMREAGTKHIIFSSTCATYGEPERIPISEDLKQNPINPYGRTKLIIEWAIRDYAHAYGLGYVLFRYFNAAGADPEGRVGERHNPETHLIPLAIESAALGKQLAVFGDDYDTPDGTCIRDYVHVSDIARAHTLGINHLLSGGKSDVFNIGSGNGFSVLEVLQEAERVTGKKVPYTVKPRRAGDAPRLVAAPGKLEKTLGWKPRYASLHTIIETAWAWYQTDRKSDLKK